MSKLSPQELKEAVDRFLAWPLPEDFNPDGGVTFSTGATYRSPRWPTGTNLLTAPQAEQMLRFVLDLPSEGEQALERFSKETPSLLSTFGHSKPAGAAPLTFWWLIERGQAEGQSPTIWHTGRDTAKTRTPPLRWDVD